MTENVSKDTARQSTAKRVVVQFDRRDAGRAVSDTSGAVGHIDVAEAARRLGVSRSYLYHALAAGKLRELTRWKNPVGRWRFDAEAIERYIAARSGQMLGRALPRIRRLK